MNLRLKESSGGYVEKDAHCIIPCAGRRENYSTALVSCSVRATLPMPNESETQNAIITYEYKDY